MDDVRRLTRFLGASDPARGILVVTGAGISLASGIPTFRGTDRDAVWKRDVLELGTFAYFEEDPVGSWRWYLSRFDSVLRAEPNPAHVALADLERWQEARGGRFLLAAQNVDTLHERAGSRRLTKVHGSADRVRCSRRGCRHGEPQGSLPRSDFDLAPFLADPCAERLPRCPACGAILRQHVLWFDELYASHVDYGFEGVLEAADTADRVLFVGTSFSVGVTEAVTSTAGRRRTPMLSVDPGDHVPPHGVTALRAKAEEVLPAAVRALAAAV